ncbi:MAG: PorV/PorQ family protein [Fidelibacterota bacterium]|nr:MAG: PorV/PorQ family protein [Candidatus Neomarinimicrobiota bacterium]
MNRWFRNLIILIALIMGQNALGQTAEDQGVNMKKTGQSTMNFLQVGVVPEAAALGDAYTAVGQGIQSVFFNPAGLAEMTNKVEFFLSNTEWIADIQYIANGAAVNLARYGAIGFSLVHVDYGDIIGTRLISVAEIATDETGYVETGLVKNVGAYAFGLTYAQNISTLFKFGVSARYVIQQLGQSMLASGLKYNEHRLMVFDLGVKYYTPIKSFRFAMSIRNFANAVKYEEITTQLPMTFAVGGVVDVMDILNPTRDGSSSLLASIEFTHPNNYTERLHMGLEYTLGGMVSIRGGYVTNHDVKGWSGGFGLRPNIGGLTAKISYSYSNMDIFSDVNRLAVTFAF